jgi:hypothetical protein
MRHLAPWRLAAILLLAAIPLASSTIANSAPVILADKGNGNANTGGDHDKGHGNDADGHDEDNPGNSGNTKKDKQDKDEKDKQDAPVEAVPAGYAVDVACEAGDGATTCTFTATAPEGGKKVGMLQVPDAAICAGVVATDAKRVDPEPHTHLAGYASSGGDKETVTLTLDGAVTTGDTAIYWIKAASAVFPVTGPGLRCDLGAASEATAAVRFDVTPAATEAPSTGTVVVAVLRCAAVPADTTGFDWFGACPPAADPPRELTLAPSGGAPVAATTDATGQASFADLTPGDYTLDLVDGSWCHAVSDRVTADSEVAVEAGATSTVWVFVCEAPNGV